MHLRSPLAAVFAATLLIACSAMPGSPDARAEVAELAPGGKLRAAINFENSIVASEEAASQPRGASVDLAQELGRRLGVPVKLVTFTSAGRLVVFPSGCRSVRLSRCSSLSLPYWSRP